MSLISWAIVLIGAGLFMAVLWQTAIVYSMRPENCSSARLRWMFATHGLSVAALGLLLFLYGGGYRATPFDDVFGILFMVAGPLVAVEALLVPRDKLVKRTQLLTHAWWEVDLSDETEVSPADRVRKLRNRN
ncbi:MAG: hypothetical protein QNJ00_09180 [Woeseiaceae bacterium]|nr:hypothetical protein [Woeseiaceae bacterium]